jgi:hypothetical protein
MGACRHQQYRGYDDKAWHPGHDLTPLLIMNVDVDRDPLLVNFVGIGKWCRNYFVGSKINRPGGTAGSGSDDGARRCLTQISSALAWKRAHKLPVRAMASEVRFSGEQFVKMSI